MSSVVEDGIERVAVEQVKVRVLPDGRLTRIDASKYLGVDPRTLAQWAWAGSGPRMCKVAGRAFYFQRDLDAFIAAGTRKVA